MNGYKTAILGQTDLSSSSTTAGPPSLTPSLSPHILAGVKDVQRERRRRQGSFYRYTNNIYYSIYADLLCPVQQKLGSNTEIQIKWQDHAARALTPYRLGDDLEDIETEYDNTWIRTDYICDVCSKRTAVKEDLACVKVMDQQRHFVFVRIKEGKICEVLTELEFEKTGVTEFVHYW